MQFLHRLVLRKRYAHLEHLLPHHLLPLLLHHHHLMKDEK
jgi:hypothetical protein